LKSLIPIVLPVVFAGAAVAGSEPLAAFDVRTDRARYRFAEPVWFYVEIRNAGSTELAVENPQCSRTETRIELTDPLGTVLPMTGPSSCATSILERIPAGSSMLYAFELLEFYGVDGKNDLPFGILPPGAYSVRYRTGREASVSVPFVVEALDRSESAVFHTYLDLLSTTDPADLHGSAERFRAFVETHPDSPFAAALLCRAGLLSDLFFDSDRATEDFRRLITLFPESGFVSVAVRHLAFGMQAGGPHAESFLREIARDYPGTLAAEFASRAVSRMANAGFSRG
jgi:hypothetical protein